jgi:serine/threonine protein kinase/tetratricopeptide (TPR) repeat protein
MQFREITDRYQLEKILKSHRFGTVLRARDTASGRTVVVKMVAVTSPPRLEAGAPEFEALAATLAALESPSLPGVLDSGFTSDGNAFLVLELLEGKGLDTFHGAPPDLVLTRISQALDGLVALAAQGIAHLNLSPDNLFVVAAADARGDERVTLLGLGTAIFRPHGAEGVGTVSSENARFQAPEVTAGAATAASSGNADSRADVYSLALITCHALGATLGFGDSPVVQLPLSVSFELANDEALRQALERALRQRPGERPSLRDLREALRLAIGGDLPAAAAAEPVFQASWAPPIEVPEMPEWPPAPPQPPAAPLAAPPAMAPLAAAAPMPSIVPAAAPPAWTIPELAIPEFAVPDLPLPAPPPTISEVPPPAPSPEEPRDVLSSVDDDLLNSMITSQPLRPAPPAARPQTGAKVVPSKKTPAPAAAPAGAPARGEPWLRRPAVLGAIAGVLVIALLGGGFWLYRRHQQALADVESTPTPGLRQPFTQAPTDRLEEAKADLGEGSDLKARRALRSIAWGEQGLLPSAGCRSLNAIQENLALAAFERLPADLESGLKSGNLEILDSAVEAGAGQQASLAPEARAAYDRAKGAVDAYSQVRTAAAQGNSVQALERFAALAALLPKPTDPDDLRGQAAAAVEGKAEKLVQAGQYAEAVAALAPVQQTWPDRAGLKDRVGLYERYRQNEAKQERILADLPNIERHKKPWDGLQMLSGIAPTPHLAARFQEARGRLEDLLARLDKNPPQLVLRDGFVLNYARGTVVNLSFRATDDYQVRDVKLMARPEGGKYHEVPLDKSRTGTYTVAIPPSFHQNGTVDFYVVASDLSGHETNLGSREQPMQLKRQQGFDRILH